MQLKELYKLDLVWDTPLEGPPRGVWVGLLEMLVRTGGIDKTVGRCDLVCSFDEVDLAFGMVIYARWKLDDG